MDAKALEEWGGKGAVSYQETSGVHGLVRDFKIKVILDLAVTFKERSRAFYKNIMQMLKRPNWHLWVNSYYCSHSGPDVVAHR